MKKVISLLIVLMILLTGTVVARDIPTLKVWSFIDTFSIMINDYYLKDNPDKFNLEFTMIDSAQMQEKLDPALMSGEGPDFWAINVGEIRKYVNAGVMPDMNEYLDQAKELGIANYVIQLGTDEGGTLRTLSWQATPGALWYRRSLAEKYLGVSEPEDVAPLFSDMDTMYETALKIKEASGGKCYLFSDTYDLFQFYNGKRTSPYVVDNTIVIDPAIKEYFEDLKKYMDAGLLAMIGTWNDPWYASMSDSLVDANGEEMEIFAYPSATWFGYFCVEPNAKSADGARDTTGDWAVVEGPSFFYYGGTFYGVNGQSENLDVAKDLFAYLSLNEDFLTRYCKDTGDYPASLKVAEALTPDMSYGLLNGQNHYTLFNSIAGKIDASNTCLIDGSGFVDSQAYEYAVGNKDLETALYDYQVALIGQNPGVNMAAD